MKSIQKVHLNLSQFKSRSKIFKSLTFELKSLFKILKRFFCSHLILSMFLARSFLLAHFEFHSFPPNQPTCVAHYPNQQPCASPPAFGSLDHAPKPPQPLLVRHHFVRRPPSSPRSGTKALCHHLQFPHRDGTASSPLLPLRLQNRWPR
jgi:hypothetical protein